MITNPIKKIIFPIIHKIKLHIISCFPYQTLLSYAIPVLSKHLCSIRAASCNSVLNGLNIRGCHKFLII